MAFVALTTLETTYKKPIRQALMRKIKDNFDDHEARIIKLENAARHFDHFNFADAATPVTLPPEFAFFTSANGDVSYPAFSVVRFNNEAGFICNAQGKRNFRFDLITGPLTLIVRAKKIADVAFQIGMNTFIASTTGPSDRNGVWLERVDASNWRFVSYNGSRNNGTNFTKPTDGNWFEVKIVMESSTSVKCYVDAVLKDTLTTQVPTTSTLHGFFIATGTGSSPGSNVMDVDRYDYNVAQQGDAT